MSELIKDAIKSRSWHIENLIESEADAQVITVAEAIAIVDRYTETPKPDSEWAIAAAFEDFLRVKYPDTSEDAIFLAKDIGCYFGYFADAWVAFKAGAELPQPPKDID